jgi:hypothetical protein
MDTWGLYPWFRESGIDFIHPDDLAVVQAHSPYCMVCEVVGMDGPYLVMRFGPWKFRGKPELFRAIPPPAFRLGQRVKTKVPRTSRIGIIRAIVWHFKRNEPSFFLEVNGKALSGRYWADELEAA